MQKILENEKPTYTVKGLIFSFLMGAATAVLLWFLFFWL